MNDEEQKDLTVAELIISLQNLEGEGDTSQMYIGHHVAWLDIYHNDKSLNFRRQIIINASAT